MTPIVVISYPKSGRTWFELRAVAALSLHANKSVMRPRVRKHIEFTHLDVTLKDTTRYGPMPMPVFAPERRLVLIMREAAGTLNALWHYHTSTDIDDDTPAPLSACLRQDTPSDFVRSPWGVARLCEFLNDVEELSSGRSLDVVCYEGMFGIAGVKRQLEIMNIELSEDRVAIVDNVTTAQAMRDVDNVTGDILEGFRTICREKLAAKHIREGKPDGFEKTLSREDIEFIRSYLDAHCHLDAYRARYLEK
jgi:hypothetical protein